MTLCSSLILLVLMLIIQPNLMLHNTRGRTELLSSQELSNLPYELETCIYFIVSS